MSQATRTGMIFVQARKHKLQLKELGLIHYFLESFHLTVTHHQQQRYALYEILVIHAHVLVASTPLKYEEAKDKEEWRNVMNEEINAIERSETWEFIDLPYLVIQAKLSGFLCFLWIFNSSQNFLVSNKMTMQG